MQRSQQLDCRFFSDLRGLHKIGPVSNVVASIEQGLMCVEIGVPSMHDAAVE